MTARGSTVSQLRGVYVTSHAGGFSYRQRAGGPTPVLALGAVASADIDRLTDLSQDQFVASLNEWTRRGCWQIATAAIGVVLVLVVAQAGHPDAAIELAVYVAIAWLLARFLEQRRRRFVLMFDLDATQEVRFAGLQDALGALATSGSLRGVTDVARIFDWKRNAGAEQALSFEPAHLRQDAPPYIVSNLKPWLLATQGLQLYFFPDRLLIWKKKQFAAIGYDRLTVNSTYSIMIWDCALPNDARVVGTTWKFVRVDGGPDRRFKDNYEIPKVRVASLGLRSPTGLEIVVQATKLSAADHVESAMHDYARIRPRRAVTELRETASDAITTALEILALHGLPTSAGLRETYRELATRSHHDQLARAPREVRELARQRGIELNAAYTLVRGQLGEDTIDSAGALMPLSSSVARVSWLSTERFAMAGAVMASSFVFASFRMAAHPHARSAPAAMVHVQASAPSVPSPPPAPPSEPRMRVMIACPLREVPSTQARVLAGIAAGTELPVLRERAGWRQVRDLSGRQGWTGPKCWQAPVVSEPLRTVKSANTVKVVKPAPSQPITSTVEAVPEDPYAAEPKPARDTDLSPPLE